MSQSGSQAANGSPVSSKSVGQQSGGHGRSGGVRSSRLRGVWAAIPNSVFTYGILVLLAVLWEIVVTLGLVDVNFISKPSRIAFALVGFAQDQAVRDAMWVTLYAIGVSFVLAAVVGVVVGMILGLNALLQDAYLPFVVALLGIPKSVFLPLFMLFFGLGIGPGIAFGFVLASIQVVINVVGGIDSIERTHYRTAKAYGANSFALFRHVILPGAAPGIFAGLWHGIRNAFLGVVIAQLFVSNVGVGYLVRLYTSDFRIDDALALVFFIALVVILAGTGWESLERRLSKWRETAETSPKAAPA